MNGVGRRVSDKYGFGKIDAEGLVERARGYTLVPEEERIEVVKEERVRIGAGETRELRVELKSQVVKQVEHVEVRLRMRHKERRQVVFLSISHCSSSRWRSD